jgi:hypothetical protein
MSIVVLSNEEAEVLLAFEVHVVHLQPCLQSMNKSKQRLPRNKICLALRCPCRQCPDLAFLAVRN